MNASTKSGLLLAATLALGIVIGVAGAGALDRQRRERPGPPRPGGGLAHHMEEVIRPRDEQQTGQIRPILERAADRNRLVIRSVNDNLRASLDAMKTELAPLLDKQQRERLEAATRALPPVGGRRGPPPF